MAIPSVTNRPLINLQDCVFYNAPETLKVNADFPGTLHIRDDKEFFFKELRDSGPCVVEAYIGPKSYKSEPLALEHKFFKKVVYWWPRKLHAEKGEAKKEHAMLLGIQKVKNETYVFFKICNEKDADERTFTIEYVLTEDTRIFTSLYEPFMRFLVAHYPIASGSSENFSAESDRSSSSDEDSWDLT